MRKVFHFNKDILAHGTGWPKSIQMSLKDHPINIKTGKWLIRKNGSQMSTFVFEWIQEDAGLHRAILITSP